MADSWRDSINANDVQSIVVNVLNHPQFRSLITDVVETSGQLAPDPKPLEFLDPKRLDNGVNLGLNGPRNGPVVQVHTTIRIRQSSANVNATSNSSIAQLHSSPVAEFNAIC